ncbi:thioredoxin-dependent thiol peroxidase [Candidatus Gottesmanbacteria bacterium]|nr:thioredoxin-dependent thiol peroxidase [Candidatus Gottesmanbacteria bacterium]
MTMASDFSLPDQNGETHTLKKYKGKWVILYFYPRDDTPGCTKEACSFRDNIGEFTKRGLVIVGVSKDSVASHKKFADKYHLNFTILSDESTETIKAYNAWGEKKFMGRVFQGIIRSTVLINPKGEIVKTYEKVNPLTHSGQILHDFDTFKVTA